MAEEVIYDQIENGGDPDPLGLRKKLASKQVAPDPLGLRAELIAEKPVEQPQQAFQIQISQPTFKSAPAQITKEFTDQKPKDELAPLKLEGKARVAHEAIQNELVGNKDIKAEMIKQRRFEQVASNISVAKTDMPKTQTEIDIQRLIPQATKPQDIPVTDEDLAKEDIDIQADRGKAIRLMEEAMKKYPEKAKEIQKNLYTIDAFNSLEPDQHDRVSKIEDNAKQIAKGNLIYDARSNKLIKPLGLVGGAIEGWKQKSKLFADYDFLKNTENDAAIAMELDDRRSRRDMDEPIPVPKGKLSEITQMLGGTPIKPIFGGAIASLGGPQAGMTAGAIIGGREFAKLEYASTFQQVYNELRNQDVEKFEAVRQARSQAEQAAEVGAVTGGAMGLVGAKIGIKPIAPIPLSNSFKQAAFNVLKSSGHELGRAGLEGLAVGGVGAAGQVYKNQLAKSIGIDRPLSEGVAAQIEGGLLGTVAMAAAIKAGRGMTKPNYRTLLHGLSKMPDEQVNGMLQEKVQSGEVTQKAADETQQRINEYKGLDKLIPDNVNDETRFKIQDKIKKRQEYETQLETQDKAYRPEIKEKIKVLDEEIVNLTKEGKQKIEKPESGLSSEQAKEATEIAEEWLHEGILPDTYEEMIKKDPIGFWKMIAQQAQNRDENWRPLSEALPEEAVRDQFGDTVVDYAKELFPAPEIKEPTISVIQPGEIKHPETITIKPQDNAIPIGSSEEVYVGETPRNSEEMGARVPESGEVTGTQEQPIEESKGTGEKEIGGVPPIKKPPNVIIHAERPETQLSFRGLQDVANEFGYEDVKSRDRVSDIQERKNAEITTNEWAQRGEYQRNVDDLLNKIENKEHVPTARQRLILEQYLANESQKLRETPRTSPEFDRQLQKVKRIKDIGQIARQEAGAALRLPQGGSRPHPVNDLTDAMVAKMEANSVDKLTDQQKAEVEAQMDKYKKATDEAAGKITKLEEQVAKLEAEKEFKKAKSTTKREKKTAAERIAYRKSEIEAAREALKKLRTGESGLSAVPLFGVRELMAIAPHVKNIMIDLVAQGIDNLQDVVSHLHNEFKDVLEGLTEKNIHDIIAGEYNEKGKPLSELQRQIRDLQDEAKLINQLEALENGTPPKTEKAKRERNQKIKELRDKIKRLKAEDGAEELRAIKKRNEQTEKKIKDKIQKGEFEKEIKKSIFDLEDVKQRLPELRKEALDAIAKKEDAQHEFDLALFNDEMAKRSKFSKIVDFGGKLIHTSKALMAGIDDSATFVQNGLAMLANPKMGAKVWLKHWKEAFNDAIFKRELAAIHARPDWEIIRNSGLDIVEPHTAASKQVEEAFEQNLLAGKIKIKGEEYQPWKYTGGIFERAFTSMGNNFRLGLFEKRMDMLKAEGKTFESHPQEYKDAARAINELTGRGKMPAGLAQAAPYITPFIWAPRLLTSTINTLGLSDLVLGWKGKGYYQNLTPTQRKFALGQLGRGVAMGVAIMGAASLGGAKVDYDPRSVTFGDIIAGDHHYNVFGRYVPVIKALVQAVGGIRVRQGSEQDLDNPRYGGKTRMGIVGGFFRGKMTPAAGAVYDLAEGKNYFTQEPFGVKDLPAALLTPLSVKELKEGWQNDGTWTLLNRFLPAFEGIKTSDERDFNKSRGGSGGGAGATQTVKAKPTRPEKPIRPHR